MSHTSHALTDDFPDKAELISKLRQEDMHFARVAAQYDEVNQEVYKAEANIAPIDDLMAIELCKKRMALKDEIYRLLTKAEAAV